MTFWSVQMEEKLARLWQEPLSLKEIGEQLNPLSPVPASTLSQHARRLNLGKHAGNQLTHWRKHLTPPEDDGGGAVVKEGDAS